MSTVTVRQFRPTDPRRIVAQEAQVSEAFGLAGWSEEDWQAQRDAAIGSWTAEHDGEPVAIGFLWRRWNGRAESAMLISSGVVGPMMLPIHRHVSDILREAFESGGIHRIEAVVRAGFGPGMRWAGMLGFELEGVMRKYGPDGSDYLLYAKIDEA